ncbi:PH domain-containing protein [Streptomyces coeruleoprunus]|uniref:PH domain-containing protein n=1 Tax=Streptomyces coeruleoprunus TaxID=285563 RepID=A0ABV9XPL9_9ACTN
MTRPEQPGTPSQPTYADRVYRSPLAVVGGVLVLGIAAWMGGDAVVRGEGRTPWVAAAALLMVVPLVVAFSFRPAVYANDDRLRIRNPFRTIVLPWAAVESLRAQYTTEVLTEGGAKYQLWALPVSMRDRKRSLRGSGEAVGSVATLGELRNLAEAGATRPSAKGEPSVRWAYEIVVPAVVGLVALVVLLVTG